MPRPLPVSARIRLAVVAVLCGLAAVVSYRNGLPLVAALVAAVPVIVLPMLWSQRRD